MRLWLLSRSSAAVHWSPITAKTSRCQKCSYTRCREEENHPGSTQLAPQPDAPFFFQVCRVSGFPRKSVSGWLSPTFSPSVLKCSSTGSPSQSVSGRLSPTFSPIASCSLVIGSPKKSRSARRSPIFFPSESNTSSFGSPKKSIVGWISPIFLPFLSSSSVFELPRKSVLGRLRAGCARPDENQEPELGSLSSLRPNSNGLPDIICPASQRANQRATTTTTRTTST